MPLTYSSVNKSADESVASPIGGAEVTSSSYGSTALMDDPSEGPASAFDGDPDDGMGGIESERFGRPVGQHSIPACCPLRSITITPLDDSRARPWIEEVLVTTDRGVIRQSLPEGARPPP